MKFLQPDKEKYELMEVDHFCASGFTCHKCRERWFYTKRAMVSHEKLCIGVPAITAVPLPSAKASVAKINAGECATNMAAMIPTKQSLTEEEVAGDFVHPLTGKYRSATDGVPDRINPKSGHYKYGVRKCSKCNEFKHKNNLQRKRPIKRQTREFAIAEFRF